MPDASHPVTGPYSRVPARAPIAVLVCLGLFAAIAASVFDRPPGALDDAVTAWLHGLASRPLDAVMVAITTLGSTLAIAPIFALALAALLWRRWRREALFLGVAMIGSWTLNESLKVIIHRPRPQLDWVQAPPEFSFPSGHAMNALVLYVALAVVAWAIQGPRAGRIALTLALAVAVLVGISRVYLGDHYLSDVIGGFLAGAAWLFVVRSELGLDRRPGPDRGRQDRELVQR